MGAGVGRIGRRGVAASKSWHPGGGAAAVGWEEELLRVLGRAGCAGAGAGAGADAGAGAGAGARLMQGLQVWGGCAG